MGTDHARFKGETVKIMVTLPKDILTEIDLLISGNNLFYNRTYFISFSMGAVLFHINNPKKLISNQESQISNNENEEYKNRCTDFRNYIFTDRSLIKTYGKKKDVANILVVVPKGVVDGFYSALSDINKEDTISMKDFARYSITYYIDRILIGGPRHTYSNVLKNIDKEQFEDIIKDHEPSPDEYLGPRGSIVKPIKKGRTVKYG